MKTLFLIVAGILASTFLPNFAFAGCVTALVMHARTADYLKVRMVAQWSQSLNGIVMTGDREGSFRIVVPTVEESELLDQPNHKKTMDHLMARLRYGTPGWYSVVNQIPTGSENRWDLLDWLEARERPFYWTWLPHRQLTVVIGDMDTYDLMHRRKSVETTWGKFNKTFGIPSLLTQASYPVVTLEEVKRFEEEKGYNVARYCLQGKEQGAIDCYFHGSLRAKFIWDGMNLVDYSFNPRDLDDSQTLNEHVAMMRSVSLYNIHNGAAYRTFAEPGGVSNVAAELDMLTWLQADLRSFGQPDEGKRADPLVYRRLVAERAGYKVFTGQRDCYSTSENTDGYVFRPKQ